MTSRNDLPVDVYNGAADDLSPFFNAKSVTIIGASSDVKKYAGRPLAWLADFSFDGEVTAVNPNYQTLCGFKCYPTIADLPATPELVLIMLPAADAVAAVDACGAIGVKHAIVFASGFADDGNPGLQDDLLAAARSHGMRLIGPNCLGVVNSKNNLRATFSTYFGELDPNSNIGLLTQSGSMAVTVLLALQSRGLAVTKWAAVGNEADIGVLKLAQHLVEDPAIAVIAIYAESVLDPGGWKSLAVSANAAGKRIVVLKAGRGDIGRRAVTSHSGKVAGSYAIWRDIVEDAGIIAAEDLNDLTGIVYALSKVRSRVVGGVASLTSGGGLSVVTSDACDRYQVELTHFTEKTIAALAAHLPPRATCHNPIDTPHVDDTVFYRAGEIVLQDPGVGALMIHMTSFLRSYEKAEQYLGDLNDVAKAAGKILVVSYWGMADCLPKEIEKRLEVKGITFFSNASIAIAGLSRIITRDPSAPISAPADAHETDGGPARQTGTWLTLEPLLRDYNIPAAFPMKLADAKAAADAAANSSCIVMKLEDAEQPHKTEAGLVKVSIKTPADAAKAFDELSAKALSPNSVVVAQRQVAGSAEILVGCIRDPEVGPVILVGAGGTLIELIKDVVFAACPVTPAEALKLLARSAIYKLLQGYRGQPAVDMDRLTRLIADTSRLFAEHEIFDELEFNPVIVGPNEIAVVDVLASWS